MSVPQTDLSLDEINLGDPDFWLRSDIDGALTKLQRERPISWNEHPEAGRGFWNIVRFHDIVAVNRDTDTFRNRDGNRLYHDPEANLVRPSSSSMSEMDAPAHKRNRRIISQAFTPKKVAALRDDIQQIADRMIEEMRGEAEIDFVSRISHVLPIEVICNLLNVPLADRDYVYGLGGIAMGDQDPDVGGTPEEGTRAVLAIKQYGKELAAERRKQPTDDIFSRTVNTELEGDSLTDDELAAYFSLLVTAGNETTSNGLNQGMRGFAIFPDQLRIFLADMEGTQDTLIEEILRWGTPTKHLRRVVDQDITFQGIRFRAGDKVVQWLWAGNRDEAVFENPHDFDILRTDNPQIAFGAGGPHFCLGANLARMELGIMFRTLFTAFPKAEVCGEIRPLRSTIFSGIKSMPIALNA